MDRFFAYRSIDGGSVQSACSIRLCECMFVSRPYANLHDSNGATRASRQSCRDAARDGARRQWLARAGSLCWRRRVRERSLLISHSVLFILCDLLTPRCCRLSIGFDKAGFRTTWAVERDPAACESLEYNHPGCRVFAEDINGVLDKIRNKEPGYPHRGDVDVVIGGPPCQGFSGLNRHVER